MMWDYTECTMDLYNIYINSGVFHTFRNTEDAPNFTSVELKLSWRLMGHQQAHVMMVTGDQVTRSMQLREWRIQNLHIKEYTTGNQGQFPFFLFFSFNAHKAYNTLMISFLLAWSNMKNSLFFFLQIINSTYIYQRFVELLIFLKSL